MHQERPLLASYIDDRADPISLVDLATMLNDQVSHVAAHLPAPPPRPRPRLTSGTVDGSVRTVNGQRSSVTIPGRGHKLSLPGIQIFRVRGDKIVERWGCLDLAGLMRQLGLISG